MYNAKLEHFVFCPRPLQGPPQPFMEKSRPTHLTTSSHLFTSFCLYLENVVATLRLPQSVSVTRILEYVCSPFLLFSFCCFSRIVPSPFPRHGALLRGLISHSGCLSITPPAHAALVPAAHMHTHSYTQ